MTAEELRTEFVKNVSCYRDIDRTHIVCQNLQERDAAMNLLGDLGFNIGSYHDDVKAYKEYDQYLCPFLSGSSDEHMVELRTLDYTLKHCKNVIPFCSLPIYQEGGEDIISCDPNNAFISMYEEVSVSL